MKRLLALFLLVVVCFVLVATGQLQAYCMGVSAHSGSLLMSKEAEPGTFPFWSTQAKPGQKARHIPMMLNTAGISSQEKGQCTLTAKPMRSALKWPCLPLRR